MQLTYAKPGRDHPMFGRVDFIVADGNQPIAYKMGNQYLPIETNAAQSAPQASSEQVETQPLFVLQFKINDEPEEMTFRSKKRLEKTQAALSEKAYVTDLTVKTYQVLA